MNSKGFYFLAIVSFLTIHSSLAQGNAVSIGILYEMPQGDLGSIYKSAPLYQLSYQRLFNYKKKLNSVGVNLGYMSLSPQKPSFDFEVFLDGVRSTGTATYSTYRSYQLLFDLRTGRTLNKTLQVFGGADIGLNFTSYSYSIESVAKSESGLMEIQRYVIAPKAILSINLSKLWKINTQARYLISMGKNDNESSIWNSYFSVGAGFSYTF